MVHGSAWLGYLFVQACVTGRVIPILCSHCGEHSVGDELHMVFECPALHPMRQRYFSLFTSDTDTMRSFFGQKDHMQVFRFILDCLDFLKV